MDDRVASVLVVPGVTWVASAVVVEGVETSGKGEILGWSGSGELFHGTDMVIGSLGRGTRS